MGFRDMLVHTASKWIKIVAAATATHYLTDYERTVIVPATNDSGHITLVLPPAARVPGAFYSIRLVTLATSSVIIQEIDADATPTTLATLDTSGDDCLLYSDGVQYYVIGGTHT
jgi:hypothetical protein